MEYVWWDGTKFYQKSLIDQKPSEMDDPFTAAAILVEKQSGSLFERENVIDLLLNDLIATFYWISGQYVQNMSISRLTFLQVTLLFANHL